MYFSNSPMFRSLCTEEEESFRLWARKNYTKYEPISGTWHPVCQDECKKINENK